MTGNKVALLRLRLPPLREIQTGPLHAAWREADGSWLTAHFSNLGALSARFSPVQCEICLHPGDVSMTQISVPPLRGKQLRLAVIGAVELLALMPPEHLLVGYGNRNDAGELPVAWIASAAMQQIKAALAETGLCNETLLPPPAFLPLPDHDGEITTLKIDNWLVQRSGLGSGAILPNPPGLVGQEESDASHNWSGEGWGWGLTLSGRGNEGGTPRWMRPLAGWLLATAIVWLGGLNLYAWQLAAQGEVLKKQMVAQVKAAFPELPVVLNPLLQARQLRDARNSGDAANRVVDFPVLLNAATSLFTDSGGQVQWLHYQAGQLDIGWREGAMLRRSEVEHLQAQARQHRLVVTTDAQGVYLRAGDEPLTPPPTGSTP